MYLACTCTRLVIIIQLFFFFKQKTAYEMRISDWSSDVCSSDLAQRQIVVRVHSALRFRFKYPVIGLEARTDTVHVERAAAVGDINAMRAIAFHQRDRKSVV